MEREAMLLSLLRSEILGERAEILSDFAEISALMNMAKKQDFLHVIASALLKTDIFESEAALADERVRAMKVACERAQMLGIYRYETLMHAQGEILRIFSEEKIPHIPLKGAVMREYYPEPWHRSSCDIDILVHEEDLDRACDALAGRAGYRVEGDKKYHDIHLYSPSGTHLELHYNLRSTFAAYDKVLCRAWDYAKEDANNCCRFMLSDAFFVFHHVAHMAYHFENGGCGVKPFLDLFILQTRRETDFEGARALLAEAGLSLFFESMMALCRVWFMGDAHTALTLQTEQYVLSGGVYGTVDNSVWMGRKARGGRIGYALSRIFMPKEMLCRAYPVLERHPWLLPLMQVRRWGRILFKGGIRRGARELSANHRITEAEAAEAAAFLSELGL